MKVNINMNMNLNINNSSGEANAPYTEQWHRRADGCTVLAATLQLGKARCTVHGTAAQQCMRIYRFVVCCVLFVDCCESMDGWMDEWMNA